MQPVHYDADLCVMTKFSHLISGKWKPILLHLIRTGANRFSLMQQHMPTISRKMLTEQLRDLEQDGLIRRDELKVKAPKVVVYHLTEKGTSLRELLDGIITWCLHNMKDDVHLELVKEFTKQYPQDVRGLPWMKQGE